MAYYYTFPLFTELTRDQQLAVNETKALSLGGGPGTGKSVVCLWRHVRNYATNAKKSLLLTYTKTLKHYLQQLAIRENDKSAQNIDRTYYWLEHNATEYEEIIIDEGQDIKKEKFETFFKFAQSISYGSDERQSLYLNEVELNELLEWFKQESQFGSNANITLSRNFRNSKEILLFTRSVFPDSLIPQNTIDSSRQTGLKPILKINIGRNIEDHAQEIVRIINDFQSETHNIGILVPFTKNVDEYFAKIRNLLTADIDVTMYQSGHENFNGLSGVHITTFKSSKGTEFDTVIIPTFDRFSWIIKNMDQIGENDYYVGFTRTKLNLFLLCSDGNPNIGQPDTVSLE